jgi:succinate dehydrogenase / fumarate reductase iron-sulfur subunit
MVAQHDAEGFGGCTFTEACEAECPKEISVRNIVRLNAEYLKASLGSAEDMPAKSVK